jgi:GNAT superfamily N-acetyltransferase
MMIPEFYISTDKSKLDLNVIEDYLTNHSYWAKGRSLSTIEKSIANSLCFGVYTDKYQQVGFARVVSDFAVFAWILDVFILESYRKKGLGKLLMQEIVNYPELQGLQRWGLGTNDAHGLYEKFGFKIMAHPDHMMEKTDSPR